MNITGENFTYDYKTDTFVVTGNAVVTQMNSILTAEVVELRRRDRLLHARNRVHLVDPFGDIRADEAMLNLAEETSILTNAKITNKDRSYILKGEIVNKQVGQRYKVLNGFFTTCGCEEGTPAWSITGNQMDLQMGGKAVSQQGHFNILGHPILYLPIAIFPADTDRSSGFLSPRFGNSTYRGFQLVQPYYWAINKSSDATVALDVESAQRVGGLAEYRLVTGEGNYFVLDGSFFDESMRSEANREAAIIDPQLADDHIPVDRYQFFSMARQAITPDLTLYGDAITVSDSLTLRDMNMWTLSRGVAPGISYPSSFNLMRAATSDFGALYTYDDGFARLQGTWNQDLIQPQMFALQTLPELLVSGRKDLLGGLIYADYDVQADNFWRANGQSGQRLDINPSVTLPWRLGDYLYGFGTLDLRETLYSVGGHLINVTPVGSGGRIYNNGLTQGRLGDGGFHSREMIYGTTGIGSELERVYHFNWLSKLGITAIKNTIEPFATYTYVPPYSQSQLPLYDEIDRIEPRSLVTYGVTSRIFAKIGGTPVPDVPTNTNTGDDQDSNTPSVGAQSTYRHDGSSVELMRFTLLQAYDTSYAVTKGASSHLSDLAASANIFVYPNIAALGGTVGYSTFNNNISSASVSVTFQPWWTQNVPKLYMGNRQEEGSFLQIGWGYIGEGTPDPLTGQSATLASDYLFGRAYYDLFNRMGVYFAPVYDVLRHKMLSAEYGVRLKSPCDCWSFDMGITKTTYPSDTQYQFQLTLGGIGSVGQNPFGRNPFQARTSVLPNFY